MIRIAVSNIGLPAFNHLGLLPRLAEMGVGGLEVAPSRVWRDTWMELPPAEVAAYGKAVRDAGLTVVGLHSLFFDHPDLGLFKGADTLTHTVAFMAHLSAVCRDLGGTTLIYGGGRKRGQLPPAEAEAECDAFLDALLPRMDGHGTKLCFEPLGPKDTDFLNTAGQCLALAERFAHPALGLQLDAKALMDNDELTQATFRAVQGRLDHVHANDPGLVVVGSTGQVDHAAIGRHLAGIGYGGWVSSEQRMLTEADPLADIAASVAAIRANYGSAP
ncbi:hypothetical protein CU669_00220 [Paramagnetospirillum kuznetsovii]|uniref:Xylose isomerase-like TIM barrel domain-containing protein n=1 Tax=Paramagnetospirillum kuznetsovii TaxID=2053833 RepID=A0A364P2I4_9PROT|nr:sugar phosphate isomerase/epimerase family protein [Paramagnetospirillum kuznetsovii]RAU23568.1 hypothetical protein CU669_00220 [Paramagnetospirillum kuznetsovii]